ncbi:MAG: phosphatase PAP2 family protein [Bacillota bacterium]|nr:MAG: hypothetical protein DIU70_02305 [Bacillota bacterium]
MAVIRWLQGLMPGDGWVTFWSLVTRIYSEDVFMVLMPVAYWLLPRRQSRLLAGVFLVNIWLNDLFKALVWHPRPPADGIRVVPVDAGGPGFPSGHAQGSAAVGATLAGLWRRRWLTALVGAVIFLVGVSRLYLGVHWPADVAGGWALGLGVAWAAPRVQARAGAALARVGLWGRVFLGLAAPVLMLQLFAWVPALRRLESTLLPGVLGALAGFWAGSALEEDYVGYRAVRGLRAVAAIPVGLGLLLAVRYGLKAVFPVGAAWDFLRYLAIGLTATLVCPWLFRRLPGGSGAGREAA